MKKMIVWMLCLSGWAFGQNFGSPFNSSSPSTFTQDVGQATQARLLADTEYFVPGETLMLGVVLDMKPHWHTYWSNPGDSGMPTTINWDLPEGFSVGKIIWPTPKRFVLEGLVSLGYEGKVILRVPLQTPKNFRIGDTATLAGKVSWLECKEVCLPGTAETSLQITAAEKAGTQNPEMEMPLSQHYNQTPWQGIYRTEGNQVVLQVNADAAKGPFIHFFPFEEGAWVLEPEPEIRETAEGIEIVLTRSATSPDPHPVPKGLLVNEQNEAYTLGGYQQVLTSELLLSEESASTGGLLPVLFLAFLGGVLLNLLPCVFPVLGLKISGFVESAHGDPKQAKVHALVFAGGVLCSLWILAAVVSSLNLAWGAQLGDPTTLIILILLLSLFTLNLFGVFELGHVFTRLGAGVSQKKGYAGSFFSGVLVTVIATPCTGPFMAGAISWALTQSAVYAFLAFTALGLGISAPYVLLSFSPKLMEKMPRPGPWMETFKQGSAFLMLAFVWVLLWVLSSLIPVAALMRVTGAILIVILAGWIFGKWGAIHRSQKSQWMSKILTLLLILLAFRVSFSYREPLLEVTAQLEQRIQAGDPILYQELDPQLYAELRDRGVTVHWTPFTPEKLAGYLAAKQPVLIDFTAKWCLTCQANKRSTLHRDDVLRTLQDAGVVTLSADLTRDDPVLKKVLASYGRRGVPTYILYNKQGNWSLLPETLTPGIVTGAINQFLNPKETL